MPTWKRTHTCGDLRTQHVGQSVTLNGWVDTSRDHGGLVFVDLRDRYGTTQVVFDPARGEEFLAAARALRGQYVISVAGQVAGRPPGTVNRRLATGEIELRAEYLEVLNRSETPPFDLLAPEEPGEDVRLKYRYLDLRRPAMQKTMILRHRMWQVIRRYLEEHGFVEIETPILARSTPEGARDYLVPSRIQPGSWYALPQSPQLFKQILMVAGYDKYFQIARCFRDEDLRADRQPEFTQLDLEMSFVDREDVMAVVEGLTAELADKLLGKQVSLPLPCMKYDDALERYGSDRPDLRFGLEISDISEIARDCEFAIFRDAVRSGGRVRGLCVKQAAEKFSRKDITGLEDYVKQNKAKGLAWFKVEPEALASPIAKFFGPDLQQAIRTRTAAEPGDLLLFVADRFEITNAALSPLRQRLADQLKLYDPDDFHCSWVIDFPLLDWDDEENRWVAQHHPFTMPLPEDLDKLSTDPGAVRAQAYDLVINGLECAGGTIRLHRPDLQQQVFGLLGINPQQAEERFGFLLEALRYGAPPHGGIALGLDRWVMKFGGRDSIRDVVPFPKNQRAMDLMTGAPAPIEPKQLRELGISIQAPQPNPKT